MRFTVSVDFDGVIALLEEDEHPAIGEMMPGVGKFLKWCRRRGFCLILDTCREDDNLEMALRWMEARDLRKYFEYINTNSEERIRHYGKDCRKISVNMSIDDTDAGFPVREVKSCKKVYRYVRWDKLQLYLREAERRFLKSHR